LRQVRAEKLTEGQTDFPETDAGLNWDESEALARSMPVAPSEEILDLSAHSAGLRFESESFDDDLLIHAIDFTGRSLSSQIEMEFWPGSLPIARDRAGYSWVADMPPGAPAWGSIYSCCHYDPALLLQAQSTGEFVGDVLKLHVPSGRAPSKPRQRCVG
jgi:hypothetical protein